MPSTPFSTFMLGELATRLNQVGESLGLVKNNITYSMLSSKQKTFPKLQTFNTLSGIPQLFYYWWNYRQIRLSVEFQALDQLFRYAKAFDQQYLDHLERFDALQAYYNNPEIAAALNKATQGGFEINLDRLKGLLLNQPNADENKKTQQINYFNDGLLDALQKNKSNPAVHLHEGEQAVIEEVFNLLRPKKTNHAEALSHLPESGTAADYQNMVPSPSSSMASLDDNFRLEVGSTQNNYFNVPKPHKVVCGIFFESYDLVIMRELSDNINKHYTTLKNLTEEASVTLDDNQNTLNNTQLSLGYKVQNYLKNLFADLWKKPEPEPVVQVAEPAQDKDRVIPDLSKGAQAVYAAVCERLSAAQKQVNSTAATNFFSFGRSNQVTPVSGLNADPFQRPQSPSNSSS